MIIVIGSPFQLRMIPPRSSVSRGRVSGVSYMLGSVAAVFDRRANGLNFLRLCLAAGVIIWHSFPLTGHNIGFAPARQFMSSISVDGFFAISGFLIAGSWVGRPHLGAFLRARALRILPGFYTCLLFTALVLAPVVVFLTGGGRLGLAGELSYIKANALMWISKYDIAGSPVAVPYPHVWNGSLWTLAWECLCYLGVAALGLAGVLRHRRLATGAFVLVWLVAVAVLVHVPHADNFLITTFARFAPMFMAGVMIQQWADRIPVRRPLIIAAAIILAGSTVLPDYRLLAALPIAYLLIVAGSFIRSPRLRLRNDISYGVYVYAFPIQQSLALFGAWKLGIPMFALLGLLFTIPFATASWFGVERHALRLKGSRVPAAARQLDRV